MFTCTICHFETLLDDVVVGGSGQTCICLSCYLRETGAFRPVPEPLVKEVRAVLTALPQLIGTPWSG